MSALRGKYVFKKRIPQQICHFRNVFYFVRNPIDFSSVGAIRARNFAHAVSAVSAIKHSQTQSNATNTVSAVSAIKHNQTRSTQSTQSNTVKHSQRGQTQATHSRPRPTQSVQSAQSNATKRAQRNRNNQTIRCLTILLPLLDSRLSCADGGKYNILCRPC